MTVTYGDLLTRAAGSVHDGATQIQHRPFDTHAEALRALADFHGVLDALQAHVWALIRPGRAAGITSSLHPEPSEITALTLSQAIADVTGAVRPRGPAGRRVPTGRRLGAAGSGADAPLR